MRQVINHKQCSAAWHQHRREHFNASDAPAMLGCSPYKTRSALLHETATGIVDAEIDPATARRFADGHRIEALARPLAEQIIGEELAPLVLADGKYSASFDGLTFEGDTAWECKTLNAALRDAIPNRLDGIPESGHQLPEHYRAQLEQQAMVSGCERILFTAASLDGDEISEGRHCWYTPDPAMRARLVAGWEQFEKDVAAYVPTEPVAPVVAAPMESLPAVSVRVDGQLAIVSNLPAFGQALRDFIDKIPTAPSTDQEFADTEAACKALKNAEDALEAAESNALAQLADVDTMRRFVADYRALARSTRLQREKLVTLRKDEIRRDIVNQGMHALRQHIAELNAAMPADYMPTVPADFAGAIKGKRTVDSLRDAVDTELARAKIVASGTATRIHANVQAIRNSGLVVPDAATLVLKATDDLEAILAQRVAADKARIEAERERIRQEEVERLLQEELHKAKLEQLQRGMDSLTAQHIGEVAAEIAGRAKHDTDPRFAAVVASAPAPADETPTLTLGAINERLSPISVSAAGLAEFGIEPLATKKAAKLYSQSQFEQLCRAIVRCATDALRGEMEAA